MTARTIFAGASLLSLLACNAITGAGEPEVVAGEGGGAGTLSTTASSGGAPGATGGGGPGSAGGGGPGGGAEDADAQPGDPPRCGDGVRDAAEEACDDGNEIDGDGCSARCELQCGDLEVARDATASCVFFSPEDDDRSWEDARAACQGAGGDLLVLHDLDLALLGGRLDGLAHVGGLRAEDGAFEWIDGETVDEADVEGTGDCLAAGRSAGTGQGEWSLVAVPCSARQRFLCERDPTSAP